MTPARTSATKTVVALPGEGIGLEVVDATCELLAATGLPLRIVTPPQGAAAVKSHGVPLPDETKQAARAADGVLFGAAGGPDTSAVVAWLTILTLQVSSRSRERAIPRPAVLQHTWRVDRPAGAHPRSWSDP